MVIKSFFYVYNIFKTIYTYLLGNLNLRSYGSLPIGTEFVMQFAIIYITFALITNEIAWLVNVQMGDFLGALGSAVGMKTAMGVLAFITLFFKTRLGLFVLLFQVGMGLASFIMEGFSSEVYMAFAPYLLSFGLLVSLAFSLFVTKQVEGNVVPLHFLTITICYYLFFAIFIGYGI